jgi:hypothetical protein
MLGAQGKRTALKDGAEMSDNVSTLRNMAASNWAARYEWADELTAAADEIERLRSRLEIDPRHAYDGIDSRDETIRMQAAEIERLRAEIHARDEACVEAMDSVRRKALEEVRAAIEAIPENELTLFADRKWSAVQLTKHIAKLAIETVRKTGEK